jgi:hypothetical protein
VSLVESYANVPGEAKGRGDGGGGGIGIGLCACVCVCARARVCGCACVFARVCAEGDAREAQYTEGELRYFFGLTAQAAEMITREGIKIDYLHIDADHTHQVGGWVGGYVHRRVYGGREGTHSTVRCRTVPLGTLLDH